MNDKTHKNDYQLLLEQLKAIPKEQVFAPRKPVDIASQDGFDLSSWAAHDREALEGAGLDWALVESLPVRAGALRQAETYWQLEYQKSHEAVRLWKKESPRAYDLRDLLIRSFRYALHGDAKAMKKLTEINEGNRRPDMLLDLNILADMGRGYPAELEAIKFDFALLDEASELVRRVSPILADYRGSQRYNESKDIRDRAYTFLHQGLEEVRRCGFFALHGNEDRLKGYKALYKPRTSNSKDKKAEPETGGEGEEQTPTGTD